MWCSGRREQTPPAQYSFLSPDHFPIFKILNICYICKISTRSSYHLIAWSLLLSRVFMQLSVPFQISRGKTRGREGARQGKARLWDGIQILLHSVSMVSSWISPQPLCEHSPGFQTEHRLQIKSQQSVLESIRIHRERYYQVVYDGNFWNSIVIYYCVFNKLCQKGLTFFKLHSFISGKLNYWRVEIKGERTGKCWKYREILSIVKNRQMKNLTILHIKFNSVLIIMAHVNFHLNWN